VFFLVFIIARRRDFVSLPLSLSYGVVLLSGKATTDMSISLFPRQSSLHPSPHSTNPTRPDLEEKALAA
jgi:hypothetical protein